MASDDKVSDGEKPAATPKQAISSRGSINTLTADTGHTSDAFDKGEEEVHDDVVQLARRLISRSQGAGAPASLFPLPGNGPLDPNSDQFNAKK